MNSRQPWTIRPYAEGDDADVCRLFGTVFGRTMTPRKYRWKLHEAPWGSEIPNVWLAVRNDQVIGQYAGTPQRLKLGEQVVLVLHGCDVMTDPQNRRRGVLTSLGAAATAAWKKANVYAVTGLHYGGWGRRRHELGWREQFKVFWYWRPLTGGALGISPNVVSRLTRGLGGPAISAWHWAWQRSLHRSAGSVQISLSTQSSHAFDALWDQTKSRYDALVVRDRAWVDYRYRDAPTRYEILEASDRGHLVGYAAYQWAGPGSTAVIADLFAAPDDRAVRAALLLTATDRLRRMGAPAVTTFASPRSVVAHDLAQAGFVRRRVGFDVSLVPLASEQPDSLMTDPVRWYTMPGDFDVA